MLEAGIDSRVILRRMLVFASEDIGLADPNALKIAKTAFDSFEILGLPEGRLVIYQAAVYLAMAPKSNSIYKAEKQAKELIKTHGIQNVPESIRANNNSYKYPHNYSDYLIKQQYMPDKIIDEDILDLNQFGKEKRFKKRWEKIKSKIKIEKEDS